jgi:hypothetical protein
MVKLSARFSDLETVNSHTDSDKDSKSSPNQPSAVTPRATAGFLRTAFRALARPVRPLQPTSIPDESDETDTYHVGEYENKVYHSWISELETNEEPVELDSVPIARPPPVELPA